jgi:SAM-dependent methyltransferase
VHPELFDMRLRALRRDRAARHGPVLFLHERAFADTLDRIALVKRQFDSALIVGCPDPDWPARLGAIAADVTAVDPGPLFAAAADGTWIIEDQWTPSPNEFDLCIALGTIDSINDVAKALRSLGRALRADSLLIGAVIGGESLVSLRHAMHAADRLMGFSSAHLHPRLDGSSLAALLSASGFVMPVVDVDRVKVSYRSLGHLISDLRRMGSGNILHDRSRLPLSRGARTAAAKAFAEAGNGEHTIEAFELLHFAAWTPSPIQGEQKEG